MKFGRIVAGVVAVGLVIGGLTACTTDADTASYNLSQEAESFKVPRRIIAYNGITDKVALTIEGYCSVETADSALADALEITCRVGPNQYKKDFVGLSDNTFYTVDQLDTTDVSLYHYKYILKPEQVIPDFTLDVGKQ